MRAASWYFIHGGRKILADTRAEISRLAKAIADHTGKPVTVHSIEKAAPAGRKAAPKKSPAKRVMRENPMGFEIPQYAMAEERARRAHLAYLAGTKARRLAKGLRGQNRGGAVKAAEAGARKSAKFAVDVRNPKEAYTLYRPSRASADQLAREFTAAGYKVALREV